MAELHPFFVHFPIAILVVAATFDVYGAARDQKQHIQTAFIMQLMAGVAAIFSAISGNLAEANIVAKESLHLSVVGAFERHTSMGNALVWVIILIVVGRTIAVLEKKAWAHNGWVFPLVSVALAILVLVTSLLGGELNREILGYFVAD